MMAADSGTSIQVRCRMPRDCKGRASCPGAIRRQPRCGHGKHTRVLARRHSTEARTVYLLSAAHQATSQIPYANLQSASGCSRLVAYFYRKEE